jgi:hypothetical protein
LDYLLKHAHFLAVLFFGVYRLLARVEVAYQGLLENDRHVLFALVYDLFSDHRHDHIVLAFAVLAVDLPAPCSIDDLPDETQMTAHDVLHERFDGF